MFTFIVHVLYRWISELCFKKKFQIKIECEMLVRKKKEKLIQLNDWWWDKVKFTFQCHLTWSFIVNWSNKKWTIRVKTVKTFRQLLTSTFTFWWTLSKFISFQIKSKKKQKTFNVIHLINCYLIAFQTNIIKSNTPNLNQNWTRKKKLQAGSENFWWNKKVGENLSRICTSQVDNNIQ